MRTLKVFFYISLTGLLLLKGSLLAQTKVPFKKTQLIASWGMFKDRHPDGWGSWNPPYEYLKFKEDGSYVRTYLHRKGSGIVFGHYKVVNDSITFYDNIGTNGQVKSKLANRTCKVHNFTENEMELWEDWHRILSKRIKKCGHKKKYRVATTQENEELAMAIKKLMNDYSLIKEEGSQ